MKSKLSLLTISILLLFSCQDSTIKKHNALYGDWQFITSKGDYNEAFFTDSTYHSYNLKNGVFPVAHYFIKNDTLFSDADKRNKGQSAIASFHSIEKDRIIIINRFSQDTLYRIMSGEHLISNTTLPAKKEKFKASFMKRYKAFLLERGIIDKEEENKD